MAIGVRLGTMPAGLTDRITVYPVTIVPTEMLRVPENYRTAFSFMEGVETVIQIGKQCITTQNMGWLLQKVHA